MPDAQSANRTGRAAIALMRFSTARRARSKRRGSADGALRKFLTLIVHLSAALEQRAPSRLPSSGVATSRGPIQFVGLIVGAKDEQGVVNKDALKAPGLLWSQD